jgi:acetyl esterase
LDPELAAGIPMLPVLDPADPVRCREQLAAIAAAESRSHGVSSSAVDVTTRSVASVGQFDLVCRVYRPRRSQSPLPAILWCHSGGFIYGSAALEDDDCIQMAESARAVVLAVDYRLAPEHPYPAAVEDCYSALEWLVGEGQNLGVDATRVAIAGVSAGACLAAAVALLARDRGGPALIYQQLINPVLDDRMTTASMQKFTNTPVFDRTTAEAIWRHYLGPNRTEPDKYAAPARATDVRALPPAFVEVSELDPARDEGLAYAIALLNAGVSVELHAFPGTFHGSDAIRTAAVTQRAIRERTTALKVALE